VIKGRHQISTGVWFERLLSNEFAPRNQAGVASFQDLGHFLTGSLQSFSATPTQTRMYWRQLEGAWFVQDNIQLRSNLTVQIGLRHEFNNGWNEAQGHASNYYLVDGVFQTAPVIGSSVYGVNNAKRLFGPRVGLAWDPFGKGRTSIRAGFGTHYSEHDALGNVTDGNFPYNGTESFQGVPFAPLIPVNPAIPLLPPCGPGLPGSAGAGTCTAVPYAPGGVQQNVQTPTIEEWNFSVEQGVTSNMSLRVSYVGSHGFHIVQSDNPDVVPSQICATATCVAGGATSAKTGTSVVTQGTVYVPVSPVPNPFVAPASYLGSYGVSSYNALSTELTRRFTAGLQFKANYTFSKELDISDGYSGDPGVGNLQDYWRPVQSGYGVSGNNQKHRFVFSGGYELPFGRNKPLLSTVTGAWDKLASGWQINSIVSVLSGFPFSVTSGVNQSHNATSGSGSDRPSYSPAFLGPIVCPHFCTTTTGVADQWYNPAAFILPPVGTFGNVPKNVLQGPNLRDIDISLFKTTTITERVKLQFRAEGFNVSNRANYSNPSTGAQSVFSNATTVSPTAGIIQSTATTSRQLQFGLKLMF
jgi:hypothetical protein